MNSGFFTSDHLTVKKKLPPVLKVLVPVEVKKAKKEKQFTEVKKPQAMLDIECYVNYFLIKFRREDNAVFHEFEMIDELDVPLDRVGVKKLLRKYEIVTFNGNHYDVSMLKFALQIEDCTNEDLKCASDELIKSDMAAYKFDEKYDLSPLRDFDHIDLKAMAPVGTSLKLCGSRLHCTKLQELPYPEESELVEKQMDNVNLYCGNDLEVTSVLKSSLAEEIELRRILSKRYGIDLMSKSDAQIAEEIIKIEVFNRTGKKPKKPEDLQTTTFNYRIPDFITFVNPELNAILDILKKNKFTACPVNSGIKMPEELSDKKIQIGNSIYRMGIGGLHSTEKTAYHLADDEYDLWDWDVTSYYPDIMIQCGLYPKRIGKIFLPIFTELKDERVEAKEAGDKVKADSMKLVINGTFGKTGSPWSILYAPELMIQVTITGQLSLLMLIDAMERRGFSIVSGNTDGIVIKCKRGREDDMRAIIKQWEKRTGFNMEFTNYAGLYSRDVNNYIAIQHDGEVKLKGCFAHGKRQKNPEHDICTDALIEYLKFGTPVEDTIRACKDLRKFISVRQVNGGAVVDAKSLFSKPLVETLSKEELAELTELRMQGEQKYLGKVVRWYYSTEVRGTINYKKNNNKVPASDGARPLMTLPEEFPTDVNYNWYANRCRDLFYTQKEK